MEPIHLEGLSMLYGKNDKPPVCPRCKTNKNVEWDEGTWLCSGCDHEVEAR
jgi:ribosomal protein L37AE/L43A